MSGATVISACHHNAGNQEEQPSEPIKKPNKAVDKLNFLFICSKNEWRSRTAETIFQKEERFSVKSAGTSKTARIRINESLIAWSDKIFVMEDKHKQRLFEMFGEQLESKEIIVLGIPDDYQYMDTELIEELKDSVYFYLED